MKGEKKKSGQGDDPGSSISLKLLYSCPWECSREAAVSPYLFLKWNITGPRGKALREEGKRSAEKERLAQSSRSVTARRKAENDQDN